MVAVWNVVQLPVRIMFVWLWHKCERSSHTFQKCECTFLYLTLMNTFFVSFSLGRMHLSMLLTTCVVEKQGKGFDPQFNLTNVKAKRQTDLSMFAIQSKVNSPDMGVLVNFVWLEKSVIRTTNLEGQDKNLQILYFFFSHEPIFCLEGSLPLPKAPVLQTLLIPHHCV